MLMKQSENDSKSCGQSEDNNESTIDRNRTPNVSKINNRSMDVLGDDIMKFILHSEFGKDDQSHFENEKTLKDEF